VQVGDVVLRRDETAVEQTRKYVQVVKVHHGMNGNCLVSRQPVQIVWGRNVLGEDQANTQADHGDS
jgi:hypothetical protein